MEQDLPMICGWRLDLESNQRGEFWIDREALTEAMSSRTPSERAMLRWGIVEEFNRGLEDILVEDQAVGEMRDDLSDQ